MDKKTKANRWNQLLGRDAGGNGEILHYKPSDDPAYQAQKAEEDKGHRYGYGNLNILDYLVPDRDPNLEYMAQEPEEYTLARYIHNRKKVFTWEQVALLFGGIATLFGGAAITGSAGTMFGLMSIPLGAGAAFGAAIAVASIAATVGFVAGYFAFRTDIKNDVDIEEMLAKRIGRHVATNLEPIIENPDVNKQQAHVYEPQMIPKIGAYGGSYAREGAQSRPGGLFSTKAQVVDAAADAYFHAMLEAGTFDPSAVQNASQAEIERMTKPGLDAAIQVIAAHSDQLPEAQTTEQNKLEKLGYDLGEAAASKGQQMVNDALIQPANLMAAHESKHDGILEEQLVSKHLH